MRGTDVVGVKEIAKRFKVDRDTVDKWRHRAATGFPEPGGEVGGRPAWDWPVVQWWGERTGRLRPTKVVVVPTETRPPGEFGVNGTRLLNTMWGAAPTAPEGAVAVNLVEYYERATAVHFASVLDAMAERFGDDTLTNCFGFNMVEVEDDDRQGVIDVIDLRTYTYANFPADHADEYWATMDLAARRDTWMTVAELRDAVLALLGKYPDLMVTRRARRVSGIPAHDGFREPGRWEAKVCIGGGTREWHGEQPARQNIGPVDDPAHLGWTSSAGWDVLVEDRQQRRRTPAMGAIGATPTQATPNP